MTCLLDGNACIEVRDVEVDGRCLHLRFFPVGTRKESYRVHYVVCSVLYRTLLCTNYPSAPLPRPNYQKYLLRKTNGNTLPKSPQLHIFIISYLILPFTRFRPFIKTKNRRMISELCFLLNL